MKISRSLALLALALAIAPAAVDADTLLVERVDKAASVQRGITMDQVLARYGEPAERIAPVGGDRPQLWAAAIADSLDSWLNSARLPDRGALHGYPLNQRPAWGAAATADSGLTRHP